MGSHSVVSNNQHRVVPAAGSTRLFQMALRWRPARHHTRAHQARVAARATAKAMAENCGSKPRASLATLAAGLAGTPVCVDTQITQIAMTEALKNSRVNQSIKADMLRRSVGRAKAASAARAGRLSSRARSEGRVPTAQPSVTSTN